MYDLHLEIFEMKIKYLQKIKRNKNQKWNKNAYKIIGEMWRLELGI